jgi:hypothetical protein
MNEQTTTHEFNHDLNNERNTRNIHAPFILETLKRFCSANGLTYEHSRNGSKAEDRLGADILLKVKEKPIPLKVDLKTSNSDVWRVAVEWRYGRNQQQMPWAISGKSDLIIWLNPKHEHFYYADAKKLAQRIKDLTDSERKHLILNEKRFENRAGGSQFETVCNLMPPSYFVDFVAGFGGVL